jgi:hypothetical protein
MPRKGQLRPPMIPLQVAFDRVMESIDGCDDRVAVFMVGGNLMCTKSSSPSFEGNLDRLGGGIVGVYTIAADARHVLEDLKQFYRQ